MERDTQSRTAQVWGQGVFVFLAILGVLVVTEGKVRGGESGPHPAEVRFIDTHGHLSPSGGCDLTAGAAQALYAMENFGIRQTLIMPTPHDAPFQSGACGDYTELAAVVNAYPEQFAFLGGGATLNAMIQDAVNGVSPETLPFEETVLAILRSGAVGFGEVAAEHFSRRATQPHISAPPDHAFFLLLADIAARYRVPIDFHMEAVPCVKVSGGVCGIDLPEELGDGLNPSFLAENISAFERLLAHNRHARIVWAHAGWDNTGYRTVELISRLLRAHPNLYMNIKIRPGDEDPSPNRPVDADGRILPEWLDLMRAFPNRFLIGLDLKYPEEWHSQPDQFLLLQGLTQPFRDFLDQLPPGLARLVGYGNAVRIYNLNQRMICHDPGTPGEKTMWVDARAVNEHLAHGDRVGAC